MSEDCALIVCEDGYVLPGRAWGARGRTVGEAVFSTGMTGYQETLTDPSYRRQIVVQTAPHIGNTGINDEDSESRQVWVAGYVVRDPSPRASNWRTSGELEELLRDQGIVGIRDVDTRALTRHLREVGSLRAGIFSGDALPEGANQWPVPGYVTDVLVSLVTQVPPMVGTALVHEVSTDQSYTIEPTEMEPRATIVALDLGMKAGSPRCLAERGGRVHVLPASASLDDVLSYRPDGVFLSNGPGDPETATHEVDLARALLTRRIPVFGICLGHQILGRALGFGTYKLAYGHRGVNQPVKDLTSGRIDITAHNHGFAVDMPLDGACQAPADADFGRVEASHVSLNDGVVEGIRCLDVPALSVQFHPEAAAGPHDGGYLFDRFFALMETHRA
ncbi:glutamine-hydrolyzing carbamoyl-phosphate synthase small subunit [Nanchangia anserum]|uniref:Carbamoyl phosphate synthase small chain n=1 Tax=Nanchangia anserum TaxID=2692125 RepID=A0A8I0G7W9_9ACTO|nr:glutamine-hydrolyzing carbamoyl-phosphate synthase small subunit [Nanchangia anserum]MBD3688784.1 glutamine-hydrolyzing carbamoyl-phosphate synthase small subunit [Nanchangia anserum]QOX82520.1 glutamine-hydrolyzing carbamoyl-phosphate synthase small subunit [Nanchangia anserum]